MTPEVFRQLFEPRLEGGLFNRAMAAFTALGPLHHFSVANCLHLGLQKQIASRIVEDLERWAGIVSQAPDRLTAHVDTKQFFDVLYVDRFLKHGDTIAGAGPFPVAAPPVRKLPRGIPPGKQLWTP